MLADTRTLDALVASHPQLHALPPHLESLGLDLSLVSTQWLMLGFVTALPSETAPLHRRVAGANGAARETPCMDVGAARVGPHP